jgi:cytochrome o ubiquinol oxidase subunit 2
MQKKSVFISGWASLGAMTLRVGCSRMPLLDPEVPSGNAERFVILVSFGLMLIVVIPVFVMSCFFGFP